jgi:hypothetical protein
MHEACAYSLALAGTAKLEDAIQPLQHASLPLTSTLPRLITLNMRAKDTRPFENSKLIKLLAHLQKRELRGVYYGFS